MNSQKIPIILASDEHIFFTIGIVIVSMLENAKDTTFYDVYILCTETINKEEKDKLYTLTLQYKNLSISFIEMKDTFKNIPSTHEHVTYVSAYKFLIPSLFPQFDKVIYLDTDIIVRKDLTELYNIDIKDNYIGGCIVFYHHLKNRFKNQDILKIQSMDYYINAGVLLMNLKEIRKDKIDKKCISLLGSFNGSVDQHIFNKICYGRIFFLPLKYNLSQSALYFFDKKQVSIFYCLKEAYQAYENPTIFHWAGKAKPWKNYNLFLAHEWFRYFIKSPFKDMNLSRTNSNRNKTFFQIAKHCLKELLMDLLEKRCY